MSDNQQHDGKTEVFNAVITAEPAQEESVNGNEENLKRSRPITAAYALTSTPIPSSKLSKKAKVIIASVISVVLVIAGSIWAVYSYRSNNDANARNAAETSCAQNLSSYNTVAFLH